MGCELLTKRKSGYQFNRQKIIFHYIVDYFCAKIKLVIEIDGTGHLGKEEYDKNRERKLNQLGLKVIRYEDLDVLNNFQLVEKDFKEQIQSREMEAGVEQK